MINKMTIGKVKKMINNDGYFFVSKSFKYLKNEKKLELINQVLHRIQVLKLQTELKLKK